MARAYDSRITGAQLATGYFNPKIFPKRLMKHFDNFLVMDQCVNREWEGTIKGAGDTVHIRQIGDIVIETYDRYQDLTYQNLSEAETILQITEQDTFSFMLDILDESDFDIPVLEEYTKRAAYALAKRMDEFIYSTGVAGVDAANKIGTALAPIALTQFNIYRYLTELNTKLVKQNALAYGQKAWIAVPPDIMLLLRNCPQFIPTNTGGNATDKGNTVVAGGSIKGTIAEFTVKETTNITANTAGVFNILAGTKDGITFAEKVALTERIKKLEKKFGQAVRGLFYYGAKVMYPKSLALLTCTASLST